MLINSNFELNTRSVEEFARVMIPEILDYTLDIETRKENKNIIVKIKTKDKESEFVYLDHLGKIEDQEVTMVKILLLKMFNRNYSWGGLMGVRPTKVVRRFLSLGYSYDEIRDILKNFMLVNDQKIELLIEVVKKELELLDRKSINLYIGIPFCPTKCKYCSFASYEIGGGVGRYYDGFVDTLLKEIEQAGNFLKSEKLNISSIYIGGGTPSTLTEEDLEKVLIGIDKYIDKSNLKEFTFEAGREDAITDKKLEIAKKYGVDRISLNPQTFNENTLKKVNRNFDRKHFDECFEKAKELGFLVNMDLIVGLPGEDTNDILNTFKEVEKYDIDNLTVHTLAFKRASNLFKESQDRVELDGEKINCELLKLVKKKKMYPYYLYRQKNIVEWGENTGFCKTGCESIFNIEMIEENQSTMGLGGGAITKIVVPETEYRDYIERYVNPKDPALYIREMEDRMKSKKELFSKLKNIITFLALFMLFVAPTFADGIKSKTDEYKLIMSNNMLDEKSKYLDINKATKQELSDAGITMKVVNSIIDYRDKTGGFISINELKRIKGIGDATFKKLKDRLAVNEPAEKKPFYINSASDEDLKLYGFDKNQVKKIRKYIEKNGKIKNNLDLMKVLPSSTYEKYKNIILYDKF